MRVGVGVGVSTIRSTALGTAPTHEYLKDHDGVQILDHDGNPIPVKPL